MHVKRIKVMDFRNYSLAEVNFVERRNFLIGNNAQGKTNLLEAIEYASRGKSQRTSSDIELIKKHANSLSIELEFQNNIGAQKVKIQISKNSNKILKSGLNALEKTVNINGTSYNSTRKLNGCLVTVSFKSEDLNLLRGGPKFRRDWIDNLASVLRRTFASDLSKYTKTIAQRNRLLKELFENGILSNTDKEQMKAWSQQAAVLGARVIKQRIEALDAILPIAKKQQKLISGDHEELKIEYKMKCIGDETSPIQDEFLIGLTTSKFSVDENSIAKSLYGLFKSRLKEEIARKQTLSGPHRDDISLKLNDEDATTYASQGQQRSLVLALKLAELNVVKNHILESPILLLDDVLAELDLLRQSYLMNSCDQDMQTIITTTHIDSFEKKWLRDAQFIEIKNGAASAEKCIQQ